MTLADPIEYLNRLEKAINDGDFLTAQTFVRNCIESALKKLANEKNIVYNSNIHLQSLNGLLKNEGLINNYWFNQLKTIIINTGNPASHSNVVDRAELIDSYNTITLFYETLVIHELNISKEKFYATRFPDFYFTTEESKLKKILGLSDDPLDIYYPHSSFQKIYQNIDITKSKFYRFLLHGSPGIGKTSALIYFSLKISKDNDRIIAIPKNKNNLQSLPNLIQNIGEAIILVIDEFELNEDNTSVFKEIDLIEDPNFILFATQRTDDYFKTITNIPLYSNYWSKKVEIQPFQSKELSEKIIDLLEKLELNVDSNNQSEIVKMILLKSEGYFFYIKSLMQDLISKRVKFITLEHLEGFPKGLYPFIAYTYYNKFVDVPEDSKKAKFQELEVLFILSNMISNRFHEHLLEQILKEFVKLKNDEVDFNFDPSSFLIKSRRYYQFPHSIWKEFFHLKENEWIHSEDFSEQIPPYLKILSRILENFRSNFDINLLYDACKFAFETPYLNDKLPVNLWINLIWQFPFIYHQRIAPFFEDIISSDKILEVVKSDCINEKVKQYRNFTSIFITKFRETRDAGNYKWAISNFKIASKLIDTLEFRDMKVQLLIANSNYYQYQREFDLALEQLEQAKEICITYNLRKYLGDVYYSMAVHLSNQEIYDKDLRDSLNNARKIYSELKDEEGLVLIKLLESEILLNEGDLEGAIEILEKEKSRVLQFDKPSASLLLDLYFKLLEVYLNYPSTRDIAMQYLEMAKELSIKLLDIRKFTLVQFHLGQISVHNQEYEKAIEHLNKTINSAEYMNDEKLKLFAQAVKADIHIRQEEYELGLELLKNNLKIAESLEIQREIMLAKRNLGRIYNYQENKTKALKFWNESYNIFKKRKELTSDDTFLWLIEYYELLLLSESTTVNEIYKIIENYWKKLPQEYTQNKIIYQRFLQTKMNQYSNLAKTYSSDPELTKLSVLLVEQKKIQEIFEAMISTDQNDFFSLTASGMNLFNISVVLSMIYDINKDSKYLKEALKYLNETALLYNSHRELEKANNLYMQARNFIELIEDKLRN